MRPLIVLAALACQQAPAPVRKSAGLTQATPAESRLLLAAARRILYEVVPQSTWFGADQLDSLTVETDDQGAVVGRRAYSTFGSERSSSGDADRYGFTGQESDATGQLHFAFRQLDPGLGRWSSADPLFGVSTAGNLNQLGEATTAYAYVGNSPATQVDPEGLARAPKKRTPKAAPALTEANALDTVKSFHGKFPSERARSGTTSGFARSSSGSWYVANNYKGFNDSQKAEIADLKLKVITPSMLGAKFKTWDKAHKANLHAEDFFALYELASGKKLEFEVTDKDTCADCAKILTARGWTTTNGATNKLSKNRKDPVNAASFKERLQLYAPAE